MVRCNVRQILRRNENKLPVIHLLGNFNQGIHCNLATDGIQKDVELIHYSERSFQALTDCQQKRQSHKTPLSTTQCLHILGLTRLVGIVFLHDKVQCLRLVIKIKITSAALQLQDFVKRCLRHFNKMFSENSPALSATQEIDFQFSNVLTNFVKLLVLILQHILRSLVLLVGFLKSRIGYLALFSLLDNLLLEARNLSFVVTCIFVGLLNLNSFQVLISGIFRRQLRSWRRPIPALFGL
mmetsp:Transcript_21950/g.36310  ORF Transcript_21950/g.36310 Transcript_21950/m.36310 type:complete len:239 (-) Transcript_21950:2656-3372(-)